MAAGIAGKAGEDHEHIPEANDLLGVGHAFAKQHFLISGKANA